MSILCQGPTCLDLFFFAERLKLDIPNNVYFCNTWIVRCNLIEKFFHLSPFSFLQCPRLNSMPTSCLTEIVNISNHLKKKMR